jgi:transcriptional regulator with XRE-family HTH domain
MAKADLRKAEMDDWRLHVGGAIERMRMLSGLSLKEFAAVLGRDERQIARWITGAERPQLDVLFAADDLRQSLVIALAELAGAGIEVETTVRIRRSA